ncbi:GH25 family lysozyme (plasmid) [Ralstonia sp. R-29]|uniref:GH25 family lysozyme n=1 Tax=Ralstonia sp. R-29 TaxID=3404059 RepID=UPI003CEAEA2F
MPEQQQTADRLPAFRASEAAWIAKMLTATEMLPQRLASFLQTEYFNEAAGRALILQPGRAFGYFYLRTQIYAQPERLAAELKGLLDMCVLLARLREHRLIYVFRTEPAVLHDMIYVSDLFQDPKPSTAHVVLNKRGDFTFEPDTIQSDAGDVIYRGVRLDGAVFDLVHDCVNGMLCIPDDCRRDLSKLIIAPAPTPATELGATSNAADRPSATPATDLNSKGPAGIAAWVQRYKTHAAATLLTLSGATGSVYWWHSPAHEAKPSPSIGAAPHAIAGDPPTVASASAPSAPSLTAPVASAASVPRPAFSIVGLDISKWNGESGAEVLESKGIAFAFARASYGMTIDPSFKTNWRRMADRGLVRGAYHFFTLQLDPETQADTAISAIGKFGANDLCPAVDFEEASLPSRAAKVPVQQVQQALLKVLAAFERKADCTPILYTNAAMGNAYLADEAFSRYPLWIADWESTSAPVVPTVWKQQGYRFWQRSARYSFSAEPNVETDFDAFVGDMQALLAMRRFAGAQAR